MATWLAMLRGDDRVRAEALNTSVAAVESAIEDLRAKLAARGVTVEPGVLALTDAEGDHLGLVVTRDSVAVRAEIEIAQAADGAMAFTPRIVRGRRTVRHEGERRADVRDLDLGDLADRVARE